MKVRLPFPHLRRSLFLVLLVALSCVPVSAAAFQPIQRNFGELTFPRVALARDDPEAPVDGTDPRDRHVEAAAARAGVRPRALRGRLGEPAERPLVRVEAYLRRIEAEQTAAIAKLRQAIPSARISWRYQVILNGMTVSIPARSCRSSRARATSAACGRA